MICMSAGWLLLYRSIPYCSDPEYYNSLYGLVGTIFQSSIFLVGVLGNLMVVITVRGTKSLHTTTNCYLVSLALADLITLLSSVPQEVLSYHILGTCLFIYNSEMSRNTILSYLDFNNLHHQGVTSYLFLTSWYLELCIFVSIYFLLSRWLVALGRCWLLSDNLLSISCYECISSVTDSIHCGEIYCNLSSNESTGQ